MPDDYAREQARRANEENTRKQKELLEQQQQMQRQIQALTQAAQNTRVRELAESQQYAREVIEQQKQAKQVERDESFRRTMEAFRDAGMEREVILVDASKLPREDPRGDRTRRDQDRIREDGSRQQALSARLHNERAQEVARRASQEPVLRDAYERRGPASESYRDPGVRDREDRTRQAADAARAAETRDRENRPQQTRDAARAAETRDSQVRQERVRRTEDDRRLDTQRLETDGAGSVTTPDRDSSFDSRYSYKNVDLEGGVTAREFAQVLQVLKNSTSAGQQAAELIEAGNVPMVVHYDKFQPVQQGTAFGKSVWITVGSSPQETAGTILHEITHYIDQADKNPGLSRTELEANAHEAEFAFRRHVGLPVQDEVEDIYRDVLDMRRAQGDSDSAAQAAARNAMIDWMLLNPVLYGIEAGNKGPLMARASRTTSGTNSPQQNVAISTPPGRSGTASIAPGGDLLEIPLTDKEVERLTRLNEILKKGGKWTDLAQFERDQLRLGRTFDKILSRWVRLIYGGGRGQVLHYVDVTPALIKQLSAKRGRVLITQGRLPSGERFDFAEIDFNLGKVDLIDLTSVDYSWHVQKTLDYKKALAKLTGLSVDAMEMRYVGTDGELLETLVEAALQ